MLNVRFVPLCLPLDFRAEAAFQIADVADFNVGSPVGFRHGDERIPFGP